VLASPKQNKHETQQAAHQPLGQARERADDTPTAHRYLHGDFDADKNFGFDGVSRSAH
jgi:hypothetical protein